MVSNVLRLSEDELVQTLERIPRAYADDPEYQAARSELPEDWPISAARPWKTELRTSSGVLKSKGACDTGCRSVLHPSGYGDKAKFGSTFPTNRGYRWPVWTEGITRTPRARDRRSARRLLTRRIASRRGGRPSGSQGPG